MWRKLAGVFLAVGLLASAGAATASPLSDGLRPLHVLNRLAFGPAPGDLAWVEAMGVQRYIAWQLSPQTIPLPRSLEAELQSLDTLRMTPVELMREYGPPPAKRGQRPDLEAVRAARVRARVIVDQASAGRLARALESPRQLQEVMVDFWFNHFNVLAAKGLDHLWVGAFEEQAIRPYALGRFRDLLGATAKHPAMLFYLDNWRNTAPDPPGRRRGINENYARELMELHTLGVNGGYAQADVIALAHLLTGWGLSSGHGRGREGDGNGFYFDPRRHDDGDQQFLGHWVKGGGIEAGEAALDLLARQPATARHVSYELAQYFVADRPPAALVDRLAQRFLATDGDIRAVLETLFESPEFWDTAYFGNKFKTPYRYLLSALRAAGRPVSNYRLIRGALAQEGMPLYGCHTPDGYGNTQDAWLNPDAMMRRLSFATALGTGHLRLTDGTAPAMEASAHEMGAADGMDHPSQRVDGSGPLASDVLMRTLGDRFSPKTRAAVESAPPALRAALILGSPEFMRY